MNITQIEENVRSLVSSFSDDDFIFGLLEAYGKPKASITRLKQGGRGSYNLSKNEGEILWKKQLLFKSTSSKRLHSIIDAFKTSDDVLRHEPRFLVVINGTDLLAIDTKTNDSLDIPIKQLHKKFDFFLPWAGLEKAQFVGENPADVKAAEKMARLFDLLRENNSVKSKDAVHAQNVFLSRLLFCYFAEDTGIFTENLFSKSIASHTNEDGHDASSYLQRVFEVLNKKSRAGLPAYLAEFPYVNGGLFADDLPVPKFSRKSRAMLIECGADLNWSEINPDIFGSMIQAVVTTEDRSNMGVHYTSVPNIMKVIEPLFLDELRDEFEKGKNSKSKLEKLLLRLEQIQIFDPACGSGNFLIIAYKELRKLEMEIFTRLQKLSSDGMFPLSRITLSQFCGIELDDFSHEIAILSLWLAEHQMNLRFKEIFGKCKPSLPLTAGGNIVCGNAAQIDWMKVCRPKSGDEIYILGNPPYLGARLQNESQKADMAATFDESVPYSNLDYIGLWFYKAARYISTSPVRTKSAFVSTNSVCQGEQTAILWLPIFELNIGIGFVHQNFKWENNAKNNAVVMCVVVGLQKDKDQTPKRIFKDGLVTLAKNISPYLVEGSNDVVHKRSKPLSKFPLISFGSMPNDGGNLLLTADEAKDLISRDPSVKALIRQTVGSHDFLNGELRYCLWLDGKSFSQHKDIAKRVELNRKLRDASSRASTKALSKTPHLFGEIRHKDGQSIVIPRHSSERRRVIPIGFLTRSEIINDSAFAIYDATPYLFGVLSSYMHTLWVRAVGGQLETRLRYSAALCYNTFPFPSVTDSQVKQIEGSALEIIAIRESYSHMTIAEMYESENEPDDLLEAHLELDRVIDSVYQGKPFRGDDDRLAALFQMYKKMSGGRNA